MNNLGILIKYEWKKLWQKKMVKIAVTAAILLQVFACLSFLMMSEAEYSTDKDGNVLQESSMSGYEKQMTEKRNAQALDGRVIDDTLISEALHPSNPENGRKEYEEIILLLHSVLEDKTMNADSDLFYRTWRSNIVLKASLDQSLNSKENAYWEKRVDKVETPFTYKYSFLWQDVLNIGMTIGTIVMMLIASCLSGVFADESKRGTDQLVLCTKNGKAPIYAAKIITGTLFGIGCVLLLYGITFAIRGGFLGFEGFGAGMQQLSPNIPYAISIGKAFLIMFGIALIVSVLHSVFSMVLSEYINNAVAVLLIMVAIMILAMAVSVPDQLRLLSQLHSYLPLNSSASWNFADFRTVPLFGARLNYFQFTAILYALMSAGIVFVGKRRYR